MRQAHIGEDGHFYDADETPHGRKRHRHPMMSNRKVMRRHGLGQAPTPVPAVTVPTPVQGVAYRQAARVAVSLAPVFPSMPTYVWSREGSHPDSQVYPGCFVVSDRYPDILFRVAFRPPVNNDPANTRLAVIDGQGAGTYIEVPIYPDGSGNPALMSDFKIVPISQYVPVEYSIQQYPVPQVDGGDTWKVDFYWIYNTIDQAGFMLSSITEVSDPATWATNSADTFVQIAGALGLVVDSIDMIGWAFDFGVIGEKELKIFTKIGTDVFIKASALYDLMNPGAANTVYKTADDSKIESFQQVVDDVTVLRPYWSAMLARALLYYQQNQMMQVFLGQKFYDRAVDFGADGVGILSVDQADLMAALTGETDAATAQSLLSTLSTNYQMAYQGIQQNWATFTSLWGQAGLGDYTPNSLYTYATLYRNMLHDNAHACMDIRNNIQSVMQGYDPGTLDGLGQVPVIPSISLPITAGLAPGLSERKAVASIIKNDLMKNQIAFEKGGMTQDEAVANARNLIKDLRTEVEKLEASTGVDQALPLSSVIEPARELQRSMVETEDPGIREQLRGKLRSLPISPENALRQGFDRMVQDLTQAERNLDAVIYQADGKTIKPIADWTKEDLQKRIQMREQAGEFLGRAFTEAFVTIQKNPDGSEALVNVMAQGMVTASGEVRTDLADKILTTIMDSAIESGLFGQSALAGVGKFVAGDLGFEVRHLSDYFQSKADALTSELNTLQYARKVVDPVTKQEKVTFVPIDPALKTKKSSQQDFYQRLAGIFSSADSPDALVREYNEKILSYQDVVNAATASGQVAMASFDAVAQADGILKEAKYLIDQMNYLYNQLVGQNALPEYVTALKDPANTGLAPALQNAIAALTGKMETLKKYAGPDGQALVNAQKLPLKDLNDALSAVTDAVRALGDARDPLLVVLQDANAKRGQVKMSTLLKVAQNVGTNVVEMSKKSSIAAVMTIVMMGPLVFGTLWGVVQLIALPFGVHIGNPVVWMTKVVEGLISLLPSPHAGDRALSEKEKDETWSPTTKLMLTALGISMIFYGKQLFPVVGTIFGTFQTAFKTLTTLAPWAQKKKGKRGRPRGEEASEKKLKGRGAPIDVEDALVELDKAKEAGDAAREERIISKLKRAAERGQSVPPGLWNLNWR